MLLHRPLGRAGVPKEVLLQRFDLFSQGEWLHLIEEARLNAPRNTAARNASAEEDLARRIDRATHLTYLGELSAARQAIPSAAMQGQNMR